MVVDQVSQLTESNMRQYYLSIILLSGLSYGTIRAEENTSAEVKSLEVEIRTLKTKQQRMNNELNVLRSRNAKVESQISDLQSMNESLASRLDSTKETCNTLAVNQKADKTELTDSIGRTKESVRATNDTLSSRTAWAIGGFTALLVGVVVVIVAFLRKFKSGATSIDEVRKAQDALLAAQDRMQEESVKLDDKLLALFDKQLSVAPKVVNDKPDHSLALKVADEIVRIELNMSRMDPSVRGYKQLAKAVERIKDNFKANGYEIVDMLGKPYNEGMKVTANFVADESLAEGAQVITGITKPQINYNGQMIQAAQITVSQNI